MKNKSSVSFPLALRFMIILAFAMLSLSLLFVTLLRLSVTKRQDLQLEKSIQQIKYCLKNQGLDELDFLTVPYYVTYSIYERESKSVLHTNDTLLPLLDSNGKNKTHLEKDFFTDGDLNIRYRSENIELRGKSYIILCAFDIANDSAAQMTASTPKLVIISLLPILLLSFGLSFLISRQTINSFKKLQEDYDREKAFTENVSHELKTPVSIIDGHANLLKRWGKNDPQQLEQSIDAILRETQNMNSVITTLLDMSRLENNKVELEKSRFFVTNLFQQLKKEFTDIYPEMIFEIFDPDFIELESDEQKLHQIFTVILSNSVKFAGPNCKIKFIAKRIANKIELSVIDNGPGFTEAGIPHVFERFYKEDQSHDRNVKGSGLGLSIAKTLANLLGASIEAKNAQEGGAQLNLIFNLLH